MTETTKVPQPKSKRPRPRLPHVALSDKLRWSMLEAAAMVSKSDTYVRELERRGQFPPRVTVPAMRGSGPGTESEFIAAEVRAWADGRDWEAMVVARLGEDWREERRAS